MRLRRELPKQENIDAGMTPEEARCAAERRFGNALLLKEVSREMRSGIWFERLIQDLRCRGAFRLVPARKLARTGTDLRAGGLGLSEKRRSVNRALIAVQAAFSLLPVLGAGLCARSLRNLLKSTPASIERASSC